MIKVLLVDDELAGRILLQQYLSEYPQFEIVAQAKNGIEAVDLIHKLKPDLVFLDIQMPGLTGFEVIAKLDEIPQVIFSTAYDEYALKAFEIHAVDYLLKPYSKERFNIAIEGFNSKNKLNALGSLAEKLITENQEHPTQILVAKDRKLHAIKTEHIIWIEAYGDYAKIHTLSDRYISNNGISVLEGKLDPSVFMRVHRSSLINTNHIVSAVKYGKEYLLKLSNDHKVNVSRTNVKKIKGLIL